MAEVKEPSKPTLPAWRVELNEKVRALKAQKEAIKANDPSLNAGTVSDTTPLSLAQEAQITNHSQNSANVINSVNLQANTLSLEAEPQSSNRPENNHRVVERALSRVKRASENAMRASLPRIEPLRSSQAATQLAIDREATARILEPPVNKPEEQPEVIHLPLAKEIPQPQRVLREPITPVKPQIVPDIPVVDHLVVEKESEPIKLLDEDHLLDYLDAEVEKVDRQLHERMGITESPDLYSHILLNAIDFLVISLSCLPFFLLMKWINGSFIESGTWVASVALVVLISTFYLSLTQFLCGKTIGMMAANAHIVDALNNQKPSLLMVLIRTIGYFIAAIPALAGFFWISLDPQHRGWHDKFSGTLVVKDF
jgi:uncharacterized RDD family membrane protein YckC